MFGELFGAAQKLLASTPPGDVANAAGDHVQSLDSGELVDHLLASVPNLPDGARGTLAQTILGVLGRNGTSEAAVADAGVPTDAAKSGDADAVGAVIEHAGTNPDALKAAAVQFIRQNPQLVQQLAPGFLQGIVGRLEGR